jgi:hypothetical protein
LPLQLPKFGVAFDGAAEFHTALIEQFAPAFRISSDV